MFKRRDEKLAKICETMCSYDQNVASAALHQYAQALQLPLRESIFDGDNIAGIFEPMDFSGANGRCVEFPLDPIAPGTEKEYVAYAIPDCAALPCAMLQGDYVTVPTYMIGNCVEWCIKKARFNNYIVEKSVEAWRQGFVKKLNDDGWHAILAAGLDRNIIVYDSAASTGQLTKRLIPLMKTIMRRNGGGNSSSMNRARLTDLFVSPEAMDDVYNWNVDQIPDQAQYEIYRTTGDVPLSGLFGVNFHVMDELGQNQEYQLYYENDLSGAMPSGKVELVVGLDLQKRDSFVMPVVEQLQMFSDMSMHKQMREGVYGWMEMGFAVLDGRRVLLGAI